jgi:hypothetical protein
MSVRLDDLLNSPDYFAHLEATNNKVFNTIDYDVLKANLVLWVGKGYPDAYNVFTFPVIGVIEDDLYKCSDSTARSLEEYVAFFLKKSLSELIAIHQAKIGGIHLSYSIDTNSVNILASKPAS